MCDPTPAIADFQLTEDSDRILVGLSGGKDSWALMQILDVLRRRAPITFSVVAVTVDSDDAQHVVIRPLVYVTEDEARSYAQECDLPIVGCCCPACDDMALQHQRVKRLVHELELEHPGVRSSMLKALGNVAARHLLDRDLNPPAALCATLVRSPTGQLDASPAP